MKYQIYVVETNDSKVITSFSEPKWGFSNEFDSIEEAYAYLSKYGDDFINYTILPHIYTY